MDLDRIRKYGISRTRKAWITNPVRSIAWRLMLPYFQGIADEISRQPETEPAPRGRIGFGTQAHQRAQPQRTLDVIEFLECVFRRFSTWPDYERILQISYETFLKPEHVILDVGANIGTHLQHFLRIAKHGRVLAFEPLPDVYCSLIERFPPDGSHLNVYNLALSHSPADSAPFVRAEGNLAESGLRQREYSESIEVKPRLISVRVDTIDNIVAAAKLQRVDYIKMDIEGGELDALRGASRTLSEFRPIVSVEYGHQAFTVYGYHQDSLFEFGEQARYKIFDPFLQFIGTRELWDAAKGRYCWDLFLVPEERAAQMKSPFFD